MKNSMKHFTVLYKKQSKREQMHPDLRGLDHSLLTMNLDAKSLDSAMRMLSKMELVKVVSVREVGEKRPMFKMATKKDFASQTYTL